MTSAMSRRRLSFGFDRFSGLYLFALFFLVFAIWTPSLFLSMATMHSVASGQAIGAILALALLVPLACGAYDLSVGATVNLSAVLVAVLQSRLGLDVWPSILVAIAVGLLVGLCNGFVIVVLKVNSFIATLATTSLITAAQMMVTGDVQPNPPTDPSFYSLALTRVGGFQIVVLYLLVIALILWWVMDYTPFGRRLYAVGSNPDAARLSGVRVGPHVWTSLVISGGLSALAGVLYCALAGPSLSFGATLLLPAFAAVFLGSTQIRPGRFNVWGTLIAIYVLATGVQGLQFVTSVRWLNYVFNGVALIAAVSFAVWRQNAAKRKPELFDEAPATGSQEEVRATSVPR